MQKKRSKRPYLGFYLQRRDHKILPPLSRDASMSRLVGTYNGDDLFSAAASGLEYESTILYNATARSNRKSLYKHRQSNSEADEDNKRSSIARQGLGYVDERAKVLTYFKLWLSPGSASASGVGMRRIPSLLFVLMKNIIPSRIRLTFHNHGDGSLILYAWKRRKKLMKMTRRTRMSFDSQWLWGMFRI